MMSGLLNGKTAAVNFGQSTGLLNLIVDALAVCRRARAAADHYEELKSLSAQALAARGLTRAELPRAAFKKLSQE